LSPSNQAWTTWHCINSFCDWQISNTKCAMTKLVITSCIPNTLVLWVIITSPTKNVLECSSTTRFISGVSNSQSISYSRNKVCAVCNEEAKKLDMLQIWTLQSGPRKSRNVVYAGDSDKAPVFKFYEELIWLQFALELVGEVVLMSRCMLLCNMEIWEQLLVW
jgi:hypothetical protein